jgi:hypothetical protein
MEAKLDDNMTLIVKISNSEPVELVNNITVNYYEANTVQNRARQEKSVHF